MIENIKYLELNGPIESSRICQLFSSISPEINTEIQSKIFQFKTTNNFFNYYTKKDVSSYLNDLNNLKINLSSICDNYYPSNASHTEKKISIISKISIFSKLIIIIQHIINDQLISIKKYLSDIFYSNEFINEHSIYNNLINIVKNITNIKNNPNSNQKIKSRKLTRDNLSNHNISNKNISYSSLYHRLDINSAIQNTVYASNNNQFGGDITPSFNMGNLLVKSTKSLNIKRICKEENGQTSKELLNDVVITKSSQISLTDMVFVVEKSEKNINEEKKTSEKDIKDLLLDMKHKKNRGNSISVTKINIEQPKHRSGNFKRLISRDGKTKIYGYLLEVIKKSYNSCYINAEEKSKLKQLIISKPKLIEEIYNNFFKRKNKEKCKIIDYLKNYI